MKKSGNYCKQFMDQVLNKNEYPIYVEITVDACWEFDCTKKRGSWSLVLVLHESCFQFSATMLFIVICNVTVICIVKEQS